MDGQSHEILDLLNYIAAQKRTLNLITNFRGIPINLTAIIIRCSQATGTLRLRVHHRQIVSLKAAGRVMVQSNLFPNMLVGDIDQIDFHKAIIILRGLRYVTGSMGSRKNIRVQPEKHIHVEVITGHGYSLLGEMIDISLDGLSILLVKDHIPHGTVFHPQTPVEIRLGLPVSAPEDPLDSSKGAIHT
jgi:hypothetical protein